MKVEAKQEFARDKSRRRIKTATYIILAIVAILGIYIFLQSIPPSPGTYDNFARCLAQSGAKFYGAFWCPHCAAQKAEFGDSKQYLPYVECSLPDESGQTQICIDNSIKSYPTWVFPDGSRLSGETPLSQLASKTGCALPGQATSTIMIATSSTTSTRISSSSPAL